MAEYKEFRVGELGFKCYHGSRLNKADRLPGNILFCTAGAENLGVAQSIGNDVETYESAITVDMFGNCFYHPGLIAGDDNVYFFVHDDLSEQVKLFLVASIQANLRGKFSYSQQFRQPNADNLSAFLPVTLSGEPDFEYMAERIRELEAERIRELEAYLIASGLSDAILTDEDKAVLAEFGEREFEFFRIGDLFEKLDVPYYGSGKRNSDVVDLRDTEHCVPVTTAKRGNNGICRWARKGAFKTYENVISVVTNGAVATGLVYYQPDEVSSLVDSYLLGLKADGMNERVGLFLACAMQKVLYPKYTRDNKAYWSCVQDDEIPLPATLDGTPDFAFMAAYVRATEKLAIQDAIRLKDDIIAATKNIVRV